MGSKFPKTVYIRYLVNVVRITLGTSRPLPIRIKEHKNLVKKGDFSKSKIAEHVFKEDHHFKWEEAEILDKEERIFRRKFKEAVYMKFLRETISQPSVELNNIWLPFVRNLHSRQT